MFAGMIARPRAISSRTNSGVMNFGRGRSERLALVLSRDQFRSASPSLVFRIAIYSISGVTMPFLA